MLIGKLDILVRTDAKPLTQGLQRAQVSLGKFGGMLAKGAAAAGAAAFTAALAGIGLAATGAAVALQDMARKGAESLKEVNKQADMIGVSASNFQRLQFAASQAGVETEDLVDVLKEVNLRIGETANEGSGPMFDLFNMKGWDFKAFAALDDMERLLWISEQVRNASSQGDKSSILDLLAGGAGQEKALGFLQQGRQQIEAAFQDANKFFVVSDKQAKQVGIAQKSWNELGLIYEGIGKTIAAELAPGFYTLAEGLKELVGQYDVPTLIAGGVDLLVDGLAWAATGVQVLYTAGLVWAMGWLPQIAAIAGAFAVLGTIIDVIAGTKMGELADSLRQNIVGTIAGLGGELQKQFRDMANGDTWGSGLLNRIEKAGNELEFKADEALNPKGSPEVLASGEGFAPDVFLPAALGMLDTSSSATVNRIWKDGEKAAEAMLASLREEHLYTVKNREEVELMRLEMSGVNEHMMERIKLSIKELELAKKRKENEERAKDLLESMKSPAEQIAEQMKEIESLKTAGALTADQAKKLKASLQGPEGDPFVRATEFGSSAAAEALARHRSGGGAAKGIDKVAKNTRDTAAGIDRLNRTMERREEVVTVSRP